MDSPREVVWTDTAKQGPSRNLQLHSTEFARVCAPLSGQNNCRTAQISTFPLSGRVVPEFNVGQLRELFQRPYRIIYHVRPDKIEVIAIVHMSRRIDQPGDEAQEGETNNVS